MSGFFGALYDKHASTISMISFRNVSLSRGKINNPFCGITFSQRKVTMFIGRTIFAEVNSSYNIYSFRINNHSTTTTRLRQVCVDVFLHE